MEELADVPDPLELVVLLEELLLAPDDVFCGVEEEAVEGLLAAEEGLDAVDWAGFEVTEEVSSVTLEEEASVSFSDAREEELSRTGFRSKRSCCVTEELSSSEEEPSGNSATEEVLSDPDCEAGSLSPLEQPVSGARSIVRAMSRAMPDRVTLCDAIFFTTNVPPM